MKGDFTRLTFDPKNHYNRVLMQQGRVQLDADWNEDAHIQAHLRGTIAKDVIGGSGAPANHDGFKISTIYDEKFGPDLAISPGRIYVNGILCELEATPLDVRFSRRKNRAEVSTLAADGRNFEVGDLVEIYVEDGNVGSQLLRIEDIDPESLTVTFKVPINDDLRRKKVAKLRRITTYKTQADYPAEKDADITVPYLAYLDVWERHVTTIEDERTREVALGGPDTATRTKIIGQVKLLPLSLDRHEGSDLFGDIPCLRELPEWNDLIAERNSRLAAQIDRSKESANPCNVLPSSLYLGMENQLYRVEIHKPGDVGEATFKWSRDNGSVSRSITKIEKNKITFENSGQNLLDVFSSGQWVEITDEQYDLREQPGVLVQLLSVDGSTLTFDPSKVEGDVGLSNENFPPERKPKVRRWDHKAEASLPISAEWIDLENGIQVAFHEGDEYRTGDFWMIPARAASGEIEWPLKDGQNPDHLQRFGVEHHHCRLALLVPERLTDEVLADEVSIREGEKIWKVADCRRLFPPLTGLVRFFYVGGGGQEAMPREELGKPLQVGASNWRWPMANVPVKFEVVEGGGTLTLEGEDIPPRSEVDSHTGPDGVAECRWVLGDSGYQRVMATMRDEDGQPMGVPIFFDADLSVASRVAFDNFRCIRMKDTDTVQEAINELCNNNALHYVGGDGQEGIPGQQLARPLLVGVSNGRWLVAKAPVKFEVVEGGGKLKLGGESILPIPVLERGEVTVTGSDGIAECRWTMGRSGPQRVKASMLDETGNQSGLPIFFTSSFIRAEEVSYHPGDCPSLADVDTVQEAIDGLCRKVSFSYVGGDGQEAMPGYELQGPLQARVNRGSLPLKDAVVRFKIVDGKALLGETRGVSGPRGVSDSELNISTDDKGMAECFCILYENVTVEAALIKPESSDKAPIRFSATASVAAEVAYTPPKECPRLSGVNNVQGAIDLLCRIDGIEPGIHIERVSLMGDDNPLLNGQRLKVEKFIAGLSVVCDEPLDPEALEDKPTCFVTLDLPFPLNNADRNIWGGDILGFQPLILASTVNVEEKTIFWTPIDKTQEWLKNDLFGLINELKLVDRLLAHLTLKGNFIWSAKDPKLYLDGEAVGIPPRDRDKQNLRLPSGDGRLGGDFEMWFWLVP